MIYCCTGFWLRQTYKVNFFIAARIVLSFAFLTKTMFITHQWFSYFWTVLAHYEDLLCFSLGPTESRLRASKKLGRDVAWTADPNGRKGYPIQYNLALSNKSWGKGEGRRHAHGYGVCLPHVAVHVLRPCFPGKGWTLLDSAVILLLQCGEGTRGGLSSCV